jgi:MarR family 2-MHQ and catechol resistance regulon transcriptional repressor
MLGVQTDKTPTVGELDQVERRASQEAIDCYLLFRFTHDLMARYVETELNGHATSTAQYGVLVNLHRMQPCSLTELSTRLFRTSGNVTSLIDRMERDGLVERSDHPEDRRVTLVQLTETGEKFLRSRRPHHRAFLSEMMSCCPREDLLRLTSLLTKLKESLEALTAARE